MTGPDTETRVITMNNLVSIGNATLIGAEQPATLRAPEIEKGVGCDFAS